MLLVRQQDKPGIIAAVSAILGRESVNISFMTVGLLIEHALQHTSLMQITFQCLFPANCNCTLLAANVALPTSHIC